MLLAVIVKEEVVVSTFTYYSRIQCNNVFLNAYYLFETFRGFYKLLCKLHKVFQAFDYFHVRVIVYLLASVY